MRQDRYRPHAPPFLLYGVLGLSLVLNMFMVMDRSDDGDDPEEVIDALAADVGGASLQARAAEAEVISTSGLRGESEWSVLRGGVSHSLARTFQAELEEGADVMTAVYGRIFMWDLNLRRDVQKGDEVAAVWRPTDDGQIELAAAWYDSNKLGRALKAYRFTAPGDTYASYWYPDGTEVALRLVGGPIENYDQITALIRSDRKNHQGMDFKADVGTAVFSAKAGTVTRINWNHAANGNCVEVRYPDGTMAKFLHLDEVQVKTGQHVKAGQVVATSGNTGNSTAPHLHYQLNRGKKVVNPLEFHGTVRRRLDENAMPSLKKEITRIEALIEGAVARAG